MSVLQNIASAHPGQVFVDSGFRRGSDIVKAMALGAGGVLIGRPLLYGLAAAGEEGVSQVLSILKDEMDRTLANMGCASMATLTPDHVTSIRG